LFNWSFSNQFILESIGFFVAKETQLVATKLSHSQPSITLSNSRLLLLQVGFTCLLHPFALDTVQ